jgi:hypothetical protein
MKDYLEASPRCMSMLKKIAEANILNDEKTFSKAIANFYDFDKVIELYYALDGIAKYEMSDADVLDFVEEGVDMLIKVASQEKSAL